MLRFFRSALWFVLPYVVAAFFAIGPLLISGESLELSAVVMRQAVEQDVLYGPAYVNPNPAYKVLMTRQRKPKILALGTSRVLQIRDFFFKQPETFYNAGRGARRLGEFRDFLEALPDDARPKILILGLDQYFFNAHWDPVDGHVNKVEKSLKNRNQRVLGQYRDVLWDQLRGKFGIWSTFRQRDPVSKHYHPLGIRARVRSQGFRPDGSVFNGAFVADPSSSPDYPDFKSTLTRVADASDRFQHASEVNPRALEELESLLDECAAQDIHVIGFLPPYAHRVWQAMQQSDGYGYLRQLPERLRLLFGQYGYFCFDFSDNESFGSNDEETVGDDAGFHGSEVAYLRMMIQMARADAVLAQYIDMAELEKILENRHSPFLVKGY